MLPILWELWRKLTSGHFGLLRSVVRVKRKCLQLQYWLITFRFSSCFFLAAVALTDIWNASRCMIVILGDTCVIAGGCRSNGLQAYQLTSVYCIYITKVAGPRILKYNLLEWITYKLRSTIGFKIKIGSYWNLLAANQPSFKICFIWPHLK